jgi:undecaprenyl-diphosphatase
VLRRLGELDVALLRFARTRGHTEAAERLARGAGRFGEHAAGWLALGLIGAALDGSRRDRWLRAAGVVGGSYALNTALKLAIRRRRPDLPGLPPLMGTPTGLSFPSAHATTSSCAATVYGRLVPRAPLAGLAAAIAATRVYLGVHYPSDVLAGALLGTAIGSAAAWR